MRHLIFDTETTALVGNSLQAERHQPRIIEFYGCVTDDSGAILEELEFFCDPGVPLSAEVTKITGIAPEQVKGQPRFKEFADRVAALIDSADAVVAHNLSYDQFVVEAEMLRLDRRVEWPQERICTVEMTEHLKGHRLKLADLHELLFGETFAGAHRARVDVEALARCYHELRSRGEI